LSGAVIGFLLAEKMQEEAQDSEFSDEGEMALLYRWFKKLVVKIVADDIRRQGQIGLALRTSWLQQQRAYQVRSRNCCKK